MTTILETFIMKIKKSELEHGEQFSIPLVRMNGVWTIENLRMRCVICEMFESHMKGKKYTTIENRFVVLFK